MFLVVDSCYTNYSIQCLFKNVTLDNCVGNCFKCAAGVWSFEMIWWTYFRLKFINWCWFIIGWFSLLHSLIFWSSFFSKNGQTQFYDWSLDLVCAFNIHLNRISLFHSFHYCKLLHFRLIESSPNYSFNLKFTLIYWRNNLLRHWLKFIRLTT